MTNEQFPRSEFNDQNETPDERDAYAPQETSDHSSAYMPPSDLPRSDRDGAERGDLGEQSDLKERGYQSDQRNQGDQGYQGQSSEQSGQSRQVQQGSRYAYGSPSNSTEYIRPDGPSYAGRGSSAYAGGSDGFVAPSSQSYGESVASGQSQSYGHRQSYDQGESPERTQYLQGGQYSRASQYAQGANGQYTQSGQYAGASRGDQYSHDSRNPYASPNPESGSASYGRVATAAPASSTKRARKTRKNGPGWGAVAAAMLVAVALSLGGAWGISEFVGSDNSTATATSSQSSHALQQPAPVISSDATWAEVAAAVSPATVSINVQGGQTADIGSGVVYDSAGHIVTNYHVVSAAENASNGRISVTLSDGRIYAAEIVGVDSSTDLAVLQIVDPPADLSVAAFGSSADVQVGQDVMAIGSPLGLSSTVTTGVVSALNRPVEVATEQQDNQQQIDPRDPFGQLPQNQNKETSPSVITNAIQVDASINPGNSGGPLFDAQDKGIGINSSIASMGSDSSSAGSIGLGFAIPSDLVKSVAEQIIANGQVDHAVLGVLITTGTATVDGTTRMGAAISEVNNGSAAAEAGLKAGDVITAVDGNAVESGKSLTGYIRRYTGGDHVSIEYVRDGKLTSADVTLQSQIQK